MKARAALLWNFIRLRSADRINNRHIILNGARFFEPNLDTSGLTDKEIVRLLVNKHIAPSPLCRAAYTESLLKNIAQTGISQYVILGAGMDTFAFREREFVSGHRVYKVDHLRHSMENIGGRLWFCHFWMDKKRSEGKHYYVYTVAGSAKFLRVYYARVTEFPRSQPSPDAC